MTGRAIIDLATVGEPDYAGLVEADRLHLLHPQHHPSEHEQPVLWTAGDGPYLIDQRGRRIFDGLSSMWNVHLGHGRRELIDAAKEQLETLAYATAYAGSTNRPAIELAELLTEVAYPSIQAFFFTSGGGEATDTSIRTARYFWQAQGKPEKRKIIARRLSYHGSTLGASSATGIDEFALVFGPRQPDFLHIASPYPYRFAAPSDGRSPGQAAADLLEEAILREGAGTVAAFIAEPIQGGGGGVIVPQDDYFQRIRQICDRHDVLLISDDVITGFGRSGRWFGLEHWNVQPDIVQFAKGITSGYIPLGGVGVSARIKQVLDEAPPERRWWHGYTNAGHPVACATGIATVRLMQRHDLPQRSAELGQRLQARLKRNLGGHPHVGDIRGLGLLAGVELVADRADKTRFPSHAPLARLLRTELFKRGLATRVLTDIICLAPPLISTEEQIDFVADAVAEAVDAVLSAQFLKDHLP
ncbi:MAG TPA: aspartate aminotransferase family protein [Candidatus Sulfotelmatobacter sp.]|jgi:adenosylmethionine-8-amino-7-oxononanoate aminotransferase|nr:aspartate aminotransferase family protein [Candidatus Sulfotelmatobacter sp.]